MRKNPRLDNNHNSIVKLLRQMGCSVLSLAAMGNGVPDLLVARNGRMLLLEIKDGTKPPSQRRLTPDEEEFRINWKAPVHVVLSVDDAIQCINNEIISARTHGPDPALRGAEAGPKT